MKDKNQIPEILTGLGMLLGAMAVIDISKGPAENLAVSAYRILLCIVAPICFSIGSYAGLLREKKQKKKEADDLDAESAELTQDGRLRLPVLISFLVLILGIVMAVGLGFGLVYSNFQWPGVFKSIVCLLLFFATLVHGFRGGFRNARLLKSAREQNVRMNFVHGLVIVAFCVALALFAIWMVEGPPYVPHPFGK